MEKQVQWYPGHMAKAYRIIKEKINLVDCIIEVLDSRIPDSSKNKSIEEVIGNTPHLLILNKADLADKKYLKEWEEYYKGLGITSITLDSLNGSKTIDIIIKGIEEVLKDKIQKAKEKGKNIYPYRAMVVGIPNAGKSTLLNNIAKRRALNVGDRPGVTKTMQYLKASDKLLLLDNPGTLWPKFESNTQAYNLALVGSIKDEILPTYRIAVYGYELLKEMYPERIKERYGFIELPENENEFFTELGKKRGCIIRGGEIDLDKTYDLFIKDIRSKKLGELTIERRSL